MTSTASAATLDALNSLLEAECNSIFHFVGAGSPYLTDASATVRQSLAVITRNLDSHTAELTHLIRHLGGLPATPRKPRAEDQYLSFLSLKFLLPKLVDAKKLMIDRYESALRAVQPIAEVRDLLLSHLESMRVDLEILKKTAAEVQTAK